MVPPDKQPPVPPLRVETARQRIIECLSGGPVSIGTLSREVGLSQKQLREQLESLRRQVTLAITPARCGGCGFEFKDRSRIGKPGKCPRCRGTHIHEPLYSLAEVWNGSAR
jgi:predicted Zn-ribbon and HTH transcriptional regulator